MVRLQDAHTAADRQAFERWIAQAPDHKRAYDRLVSSYEASALLATSKVGRRRDLEAAFARPPMALRVGLAGAAVAALLLIGLIIAYPFPQRPRMALEAVMLSSGDVARDVRLADGSAVRMAAQSQVEIDFGQTQRFARVRKGRVRLTVVDDSRPFRIIAGSSVVETKRGVFDAAVVGGQGSVAPVSRASFAQGQMRADSSLSGSTSASFAQRLEFNAEPLKFAIDRINGVHAGPRLEIDPRLADLRVTGVFQQGGSEAMARSLAVAFDLKLVETSPGVLLLTRSDPS